MFHHVTVPDALYPIRVRVKITAPDALYLIQFQTLLDPKQCQKVFKKAISTVSKETAKMLEGFNEEITLLIEIGNKEGFNEEITLLIEIGNKVVDLGWHSTENALRFISRVLPGLLSDPQKVRTAVLEMAEEVLGQEMTKSLLEGVEEIRACTELMIRQFVEAGGSSVYIDMARSLCLKIGRILTEHSPREILDGITGVIQSVDLKDMEQEFLKVVKKLLNREDCQLFFKTALLDASVQAQGLLQHAKEEAFLISQCVSPIMIQGFDNIGHALQVMLHVIPSLLSDPQKLKQTVTEFAQSTLTAPTVEMLLQEFRSSTKKTTSNNLNQSWIETEAKALGLRQSRLEAISSDKKEMVQVLIDAEDAEIAALEAELEALEQVVDESSVNPTPPLETPSQKDGEMISLNRVISIKVREGSQHDSAFAKSGGLFEEKEGDFL